jgi:hypothetical protein
MTWRGEAANQEANVTDWWQRAALLFWAKPLVIVAWGITPGRERKSLVVFWLKALFTLLLRKTGRRVAVAESMRMAFAQQTLILFLSVPGVIPQATRNRGFAQKRRPCRLATRSKSSQAAKLFNVCNTDEHG